MSYLILALAGVVAVALLAVLLLIAVVVLKAAHTRPGDRATHAHGRLERVVLRVLTTLIRAGLRVGVRLGPMVMLTVPGRRTGQPRSNPVDLWTDPAGCRYLVATHDDTAAWVRNLRAAGHGTISLGRRRWAFTAAELSQARSGEVLRRVLGPRLRRPVAGFVLRQTLAVPADAPLTDFVAAAATHPVFELTVTADREPAPTTGHHTRPLPVVLIVTGLVVVAAHLILALAGVLGTGGWISGVVIGLLVAGLGNHLRIFGRGPEREEPE